MKKTNIISKIEFESPLIKGETKNKKLNFLLTLYPELIKRKRKPLNIAYVIDQSGSMGGYLTKNIDLNHRDINMLNMYKDFNTQNTQLSLVKEAVIKSLDYLDVEDTISLIVFNHESQILLEGKTIKDKIEIIQEIKNIKHSGGTDILKGWKNGVKSITNNLKNNSLNRIILLTDGQDSFSSSNSIQELAGKINEAGITTTTFGVGLYYNEDLLMNIAESGGGNYYYIQETKDFQNLFNDEFDSLNKIIGSKVFLEIKDKDIKCLNDLKINDSGLYHIPNLVENKSNELLFSVSIKKGKYTVEELTSKKITIIYQDMESNKFEKDIEINIPLVDKKDKFKNNTVKDKILLNNVAKNKNKIAEALDKNDFDNVKLLLEKSRGETCLLSANIQSAAMESLNDLENHFNNRNFNNLRKNSVYESYNLRNSKER